MKSETNDLSKAVTLYIGFGLESWPMRDRKRIFQEFGDVHGAELKLQVDALLRETGGIAIDWSAHSLASAGDMIEKVMHLRHPELSDDAIRALGWDYTFSMR